MLNYLYRAYRFVVSFLYRTFYAELLQTDDDLFMKIRKALVGCAAAFGFIGIFLNLAMWAHGTALFSLWKTAQALTYFSVQAVCTTHVCAWVFARCTRTTPDWLMNLWIEVVLVSTAVGLISTNNWDLHVVCLACIILCLGCNTSHCRFQIATLTVYYFALMYDAAFFAFGYPGFHIPDHHVPTWLDVFGRQMINAACAVLLVWFFHMIFREIIFQIERSEAGVQMAMDVANKLVVYDTEGALALLRARMGQPNMPIDPKLLTVLTQITQNLDKYRPFLPSYVLEKGEENLKPKDPEHVPSSTLANVGIPLAQPAMASEVLPEPSPYMDNAGTSVHLQRKPSLTLESDTSSDPNTPRQPTSLEFNGILAASPTLHGLFNTPIRTVPIVVVLVDCSKVMKEALQQPSAAHVNRQVNKIVEKMHLISSFFNGTFHSLLGDIALVTWNAVGKPITQPELQAARFLFSVVDKYGPGVLHMGAARCQVAGKAHKTLTVHGEWIESAYRMLHLAVRHKALFASEEAAGILPWETRCVDAIPTRNNHGAMKVYEILLPPPQLTYLVAGRTIPRSPYSTAVCEALESCVDGHYVAALQSLGSMKHSCGSLCISNLFEKARLCQEKSIPSGDFAWVQVRSPEPLSTISS